MPKRTARKTQLPLTCLVTITLGLCMAAEPSAAKTPGKTYCFLSTCHRVLTLAETAEAVGKPREMHASHYDDPRKDRFNPSLMTSSGELFRPDAPNNAASPIYPDGTLVAVFAPTTKRGAIVRINNAGPYYGNRLIDLSRGLAEKLGIAKSGVARVTVEVLAAPRPEDARYRRGRQYPPVAGFIGTSSAIAEIRGAWQLRDGIKLAPVLAAAQPGSQPTPLSLAALISSDDMRPSAGTSPPAPPQAVAALELRRFTLQPPRPQTPMKLSLQSPVRWPPTVIRPQTLFR